MQECRKRKRVFTVWVISDPDESWQMYWCPDCRNSIAQYKGDLVMETPGVAPAKMPFLVQCRNHGCRRKIMFQDCTTRDIDE